MTAWYEKAGLRFECVAGCGACCTNHGEAAHVWLDGDDAERLARHLGVSLDEFHTRWVEVDEATSRQRLRDRGEDCVFLDGSRCSVYAARPVQCSTFPFWSANLESRRTWVSLSELCPGIDRGPVHSPLNIREHVTARRRAIRRRSSKGDA